MDNNNNKYLQAKIELVKSNVYKQNKKDNTLCKGIVLMKILNSLKSECDHIQDKKDINTKKQDEEMIEIIEKLTDIIDNFDWVDNLIKKNYPDKVQKEKFQNIKYVDEIEK